LDISPYTTALQASLCKRGRRLQKDVTQCLLRHGASINAPVYGSFGRSELALAVNLGDIKLVQQLLDLGADINPPPARQGGMSALAAAAQLNPPNFEIVQLLLKKGAHVNAPVSPVAWSTPLMAATLKGHFQIARVLLKAGADPNRSSSPRYRSSSLHYGGSLYPLEAAIVFGRLDIAHMLLEAGADPQMGNGKDPVHLARARGYTAIAEMIEEWLRTHEVEGKLENSQDSSKRKGRVIGLN